MRTDETEPSPRGRPRARWTARGLGGWQHRGFVLTPTRLSPGEPLVGGEQLHRHLVGILESLGHRTNLARSSP